MVSESARIILDLSIILLVVVTNIIDKSFTTYLTNNQGLMNTELSKQSAS